MAKIETNRKAITDRLSADGWVNQGGGSHDKFTNASLPGSVIIVPRHRTLSPGVARSIAKAAGWI